jgi:hypothetical protein
MFEDHELQPSAMIFSTIYHSLPFQPQKLYIQQKVVLHCQISCWCKNHVDNNNKYSALEPVLAGTRAQSGDWYSSDMLHSGQVLKGSLPLISPAFTGSHFCRQIPPCPNNMSAPSSKRWNGARMESGNFAKITPFLRHLWIFYMPQIYDNGQTALLPLRRKACWGFFDRKIRRLRPGLNPWTWVPEASMLTTRPEFLKLFSSGDHFY